MRQKVSLICFTVVWAIGAGSVFMLALGKDPVLRQWMTGLFFISIGLGIAIGAIDTVAKGHFRWVTFNNTNQEVGLEVIFRTQEPGRFWMFVAALLILAGGVCYTGLVFAFKMRGLT